MFFDGKDLPIDRMKTALRKATIEGTVLPMLCGSAFKNKGVQPLLDAVVEYMPSPLEAKTIVGTDPKTGDEIDAQARRRRAVLRAGIQDRDRPVRQPHAISASTRACSTRAATCYNSRTGRKERIGRILRMHANHREDIDSIGAGDIAAAVGLSDTRTGDTLCDEKIADHARVHHLPGAGDLIRRSSRRRKADQDKLGTALTRLAQEDPTFRMRTDEETQQTIIAGMGELHLEIILDRLRREFKVDANVGKPQVAYKEAITKTVEKEGRFVRQSGGKGQYGDVWIRVEPQRARHRVRLRVEDRRRLGSQGVRESRPRGHPGVGAERRAGRATRCSTSRSTAFDGSYHDVDSSEMAFKIAAFDGVEGGEPRRRSRSCSSRS